MKELAVIQEPINQLPQAQKELVQLRVGNKAISDTSRSVVKTACAEILTKASFEMGSPMADDANVLTFQTEALFNELQGKFGSLTIPELKECFRRGIRGESGPFFGMCPKTYHQFIKWYFELPERGKAWIDYLTLLEGEKKSTKPLFFTPEQFKKSAIEAFHDYKKSGKMPFVPHVIYDTIKDCLGLTTLIPLEKWQEVKEAGRKEYEKKMTIGVRDHKVKHIVSKLDTSVTNKSLEFSIKAAGLRYYFDKLITQNKDLDI